jgi:serine phosphatase RsbU (regulator of sigma subunit)
VPGLEVAVRYVAATDGVSVGGDWYDVIDLGDGCVGIAVGDVVGHDIAASTTMGQVRSALRAFACEDSSNPGSVMTRLDRLFERLSLTYATCMLGVVEPGPRLRWSSAGHPPPLLVRDGRPMFLDGGAGVMLGVGGAQAEATIALEDGDFLVLYTDGLVERRGENLEDGLNRLALAASRIDAHDAEALCDSLLDAVLPQTSRDDDVAMLVARVGDAGPPAA